MTHCAYKCPDCKPGVASNRIADEERACCVRRTELDRAAAGLGRLVVILERVGPDLE